MEELSGSLPFGLGSFKLSLDGDFLKGTGSEFSLCRKSNYNYSGHGLPETKTNT